jgi:hypothetical protein
MSDLRKTPAFGSRTWDPDNLSRSSAIKAAISQICYTCDKSIRPTEEKLISVAGIAVCSSCCVLNDLKPNA